MRIVPLLMIAYGLGLWNAGRRQRDEERQRTASAAKPPEVVNWEGEGGALRSTGSQLGPPPEFPAAGDVENDALGPVGRPPR